MLEKKSVCDDLEQFKDYQLCYVKEVSETFRDWDEKSKKIIETDEYKFYRKKVNNWIHDNCFLTKGSANLGDYDYAERLFDPAHRFEVNLKDYDDPDYLAGYTHYLYFTSDLDKQWGDDWDDAPYEHNADEPYTNETHVIMIPVKLISSGDIVIEFPKDGYINSPYSVDSINHGKCSWVFSYVMDGRKFKKSLYLMGGETLESCIKKYNELITW